MWVQSETGDDEGAVDGARVLVIDDSETTRFVLAGLLKRQYEVSVGEDGEQALALARAEPQPDLILLDVEMPGLDGFEVCRLLKTDERTRDIPVVFLTGMTQPEHESRGLWLGATDYLVKPVNPPLLMARVLNQLLVKRQADRLRQRHLQEVELLHRRLEEARELHVELLRAVVGLIGGREDDTNREVDRIPQGLRILARAMRERTHGPEAWVLSDEGLDDLCTAALVHDIGRAGLSFELLLKPGPLTEDEFALMKTHTTRGAQAIQRAQAAWGRPSSLLTLAHEMVLCHHERWDGSGYPQGLSGRQIPLSARLLAVVDAYDELTGGRTYKPAVPHEQAVQMLAQEGGRHFDPDVIAAFLDAAPDFQSMLEAADLAAPGGSGSVSAQGGV
jgi:putative two-component system response regulator